MIVDAHNDLLLELVDRRDEPNPFATRWLPKLRAGGVSLQVCPIFAVREQPRETALTQVEAFQRALRENAGDVFAVRSRADLDLVGQDDHVGLMLAIEGAEPVTAGFEEWWDAGVRMVGLTWNRSNAFAGGIEAPEQGLTAGGERS